MSNNLSALEEFDAEREWRAPHLLAPRGSVVQAKNTAFIVLQKKEEDLLIFNANAFSDPVVFAGLSMNHIEYMSKNAPMEYKSELLKIALDEFSLSEALNIAKIMDEDINNESNQNQVRVRKVIQYINDNSIVFQF